MKKLFVLLLAVMMFATLAAGCAPATTEAAPAATEAAAEVEPAATEEAPAVTEPAAPTKDTLVFMAAYNAETMDPMAGKVGDHALWHAVFDTLLNWSSDYTVTPGLAESWTKEGLDVTLTLRQGVTFSDGSPFTADDVIFTFDTMMQVPMYMQFYQTYTTWQKVDDYTVKFTAATPYANIPETLALMSFIMPQESYNAETFADSPIGTGPYTLVSRDVDGTATLVANENYWGGAPAFQNVIIKPPVDASTAVVALENGEVDVILNVPAAQIPIIEENSDLVMTQVSGFTNYDMVLMGPRLNQDINLRQAIFHGIDREKLVLIANEGIGNPSTDMLASNAMGDFAGVVNYVGYDFAMAQELAAQSSYTPDQVLMITAMPQEATMAQSIQEDLKKLGIETEIELLDVNGWQTKIMNGEAEIVFVQFGGVTDSMESFLTVFTRDFPYFGKDCYSTQEYEDLVANMKTEMDDATRQEMVRQALVMQYDFANIVSLYDSVQNHAYNKSVGGIPESSAAISIYYVKDFFPTE